MSTKQTKAASRTALAQTLLERKGSFVRVVAFGNQFGKVADGGNGKSTASADRAQATGLAHQDSDK